MKNFILLVFAAFTGIIILESFGTIGLGKKDGTEPGYTGSPGDSLKNCTFCHGGTAINVEGWIRSDVPAEGYTPGARYTITATNTEEGATRFGFSVSPQALNGTLLGTMVITDTTRTKLVGNDKYATYRADGVEGVDSLSWSFDWIAPPAGTRDVVFYGAFNSNFDGHKEGDKTYLTSLRILEKGTVSVPDLQKALSHVTIYPNPAGNLLYLKTDSKLNQQAAVMITDITGKLVLEQVLSSHIYHGGQAISTENLKAGVYILKIQSGNQFSAQKIYIVR